MGVHSAPRVWVALLGRGWRVRNAVWWARRAGCGCSVWSVAEG